MIPGRRANPLDNFQLNLMDCLMDCFVCLLHQTIRMSIRHCNYLCVHLYVYVFELQYVATCDSLLVLFFFWFVA